MVELNKENIIASVRNLFTFERENFQYLENERKKTCSLYRIFLLLIFVIFFFIFFLLIFHYFVVYGEFLNIIFYAAIIVLFLLFLTSSFILCRLSHAFETKLQDELYPKLYRVLGLNYQSYQNRDEKFEQIRKIILDSGIYKTFEENVYLSNVQNKKLFNDSFSGSYKDIPFTAFSFSAHGRKFESGYSSSVNGKKFKKRGRYVTKKVSGVCFALEHKHNLQGDVLICPEGRYFNYIGSLGDEMSEIATEDPILDKYFCFFAKEVRDADKVLTLELKAQLEAYIKKSKETVFCGLKERVWLYYVANSNLKENLFIFIENKKRNLSLKRKSLLEEETLMAYINDRLYSFEIMQDLGFFKETDAPT